MIRYLFNRVLLAMQQRYDYDVSYMQEILAADLPAFMKMMGFQTMSSHKGNLPAEIGFAVRLRAIIWDDCGPCTQLVVNMALEAGVNPETIRAIVDRDLEALDTDVRLVVEFADLVLAHDPAADALREEVVSRWGTRGLVAIGFGISSCRVYPALKYTMGYGKACSRIRVEELNLAPNRQPALAAGVIQGG